MILDQLGNPAIGLIAGELLYDLDQGVVGDRLAVGEAAPDGDGSRVADLGEELVGEPRLADSCRPDDREEAADPILASRVERGTKLVQLPFAPDERRRRPDRLLLRLQLQQPPGLDLRASSLQFERLQRLGAHMTLDEPVGPLAEEDLVCVGHLF